MLISVKQFVMGTWALTILIITTGFLANAMGLRINTTASMPAGLYWAHPRSTQALPRDTLVLFCPPATPPFQLALSRHYIGDGPCPGHSQALLKPVAAVAGDIVTLTPQGVRVNKNILPHSPVLSHDSVGHALPHLPFGQYPVKSGDVWLLSTHSPKSYDSRYFGPVAEKHITTTITPIWIGD